MCPRPYNLGRRRLAADKTRLKILAAARNLLASRAGMSGFSVDAVAQRAGVARMTVYYQFGSRIGLLEALFDYLALRGGIDQIASAFRQPDPLAALDAFIDVLARFWGSQRLVFRRIHGLAALDPDFQNVVQSRQERRRHGLQTILLRLLSERSQPASPSVENTVALLYALTSFETFDNLAGPSRQLPDVAPVVQKLARAVLEIDLHQALGQCDRIPADKTGTGAKTR